MIMNNGLKISTNLVILVDIHECSNLKDWSKFFQKEKKFKDGIYARNKNP
jgi:hypothetical protein